MKFWNVILFISLIFIGCDTTSSSQDKIQEKVLVKVNITDQPKGGTNSDQVQIMFTAFLNVIGYKSLSETPPEKREYELVGKWHQNINGNEEVFEQTFTIDSDGDPKQTIRSRFSDTGNKNYLEGEYWYTMEWIDDDGDNSLKSDKAVFSID